MTSLVNKTSRVIVVGEYMLVPGKAQQVKDVKKLATRFPRFGELLETGEIVETEAKAAAEEVKHDEAEESAKEETERPMNRRNKRG